MSPLQSVQISSGDRSSTTASGPGVVRSVSAPSPEAAPERPAMGRPSSKFDRWIGRRIWQYCGQPAVDFRLWDGTQLGEVDAPTGRLVIGDRSTLWRLLRDPAFQFGEAFVEGRVRIEGDLVEVLSALFVAMRTPGSTRGLHLPRWLRPHRPHRVNRSGARQNAHHHYDLGSDFYRLWLDEQLVYTCAYFREPQLSLEAAQVAKLDHVCRKLWLRPGERVVEAGCGWGALALHMARQYGVQVKAYNISQDQLAQARRRAAAEGLSDRVEFIDDDWREIRAPCDAFVSVGMLEHVGPQNYHQLGDVIHRCLTPQGRGLIHTIGTNYPRPLDPWTEQRIFPGAQPPALSQIMDLFEPHRFSVLDVENLRLHYAETLRHWWQRYERNIDAVRAMFDERFVQMWRLYLASSVATFRTGNLQLFQVVFAPGSNNQIPATRAGLYGVPEPH